MDKKDICIAILTSLKKIKQCTKDNACSLIDF